MSNKAVNDQMERELSRDRRASDYNENHRLYLGVGLIVLALLLALVFWVTNAGAAAPEEPRLNFSHACITMDHRTEIHFVLVHAPAGDYTGTAVSWTGFVDGAPTVSMAPFDRLMGGTAHYRDVLDAPIEELEIDTAVLVVDGTVYMLANPQIVEVEACEVPTAVDLASFETLPAGRTCHVCYCEPATRTMYCKLNCTPTAWQKLACRVRQ